MNFIKQYKWLIVIAFLALFIRLINLDKQSGLWYDEISIYSIASQSFPHGMLKADAHRFLLFPLYYFVYHFWITFFGNSDFAIRLMSVFFDILNIIAAYFAGKTLGEFLKKEENCKKNFGTFCALFSAVNSSFIYYAQEAKFYSMTFFLVNLLIIFWLKFLKNQDKKSFLYFFLANFLLIYTYTSQILLTSLFYAAAIIYFVLEKSLKKNTKFLLVLLSVYLPLAGICVFVKNYFSGNFNAVVYDNSFILLAVQNYFSPVLAGLQNNILNFQKFWIAGAFNVKFWIFVLFPAALMISGILISLKESKISRYITAIAVFYILFHITASNFTHYKALVRYTLIILPLLVLLGTAGIAGIKNTKLRNTLITLYVMISLPGIFTINGAVNIKRPDGYREAAQALLKYKVPQDADFILPIRTNLLDKYYQINGKKLSLYTLNSEATQKTYLTDNEIFGIKNDRQNLHKYYKRYLLTNFVNKDFEDFIKQNYLQNNKVVIISDKTISMFTTEQIAFLVNSADYEKYPIQFLRLSKLKNDLIKTALKYMKLKQYIIVKNWEIYVFGI